MADEPATPAPETPATDPNAAALPWDGTGEPPATTEPPAAPAAEQPIAAKPEGLNLHGLHPLRYIEGLERELELAEPKAKKFIKDELDRVRKEFAVQPPKETA